MEKQIVLGSSSPRRKSMLEALGYKITIIKPNCDEIINAVISPEQNACKIALDKLLSIRNISDNNLPLVCADTIVVCEETIYGKPKSLEDAKLTLTNLSNKMHQVITAYALLIKGKLYNDYVKTKLWFRHLDQDTIDSYIKNNSVLDKAGAYSILENGVILCDKIEGSLSNVVGLPINEIIQIINK
jgi:septum formation protein